MNRFLFTLLTFVFTAQIFAAEDYQSRYEALATDDKLSATEKLHKLFDLDWERGMHESPESATSVGYPGLDDKWTDMSQAAIDARKRFLQWPLKVIESIDRSKLSENDALNYDLFLRDTKLGIEGTKFPDELIAISQLGGVQQGIAQTLVQNPTTSVAAYENILARLRAAPVLIQQNLDLLKRGIAAGVTEPKITLREVPQQILNVIPDDPLKSAVLRPFTEFPLTISPSDQERLRAEAVKIFQEQIRPAFQKLHDFVEKEYIPAARDAVGWKSMPQGAEWYAYAVRTQTTTDMTPQEIHALGLREVARIHGEMEKIVAETGFKGSFADFLEFLKTDPQFYYTRAEDLLTGYRDIAKRIDPELPRLFGKLPRLTYGVRPVPAYAEKSQTSAYYEGGSPQAGRPGWYYANTYNLPARPKWQMECLTLHESVPGHHLQISLSQEMEDQPEFRKFGGYTAFIEGWGLYAESLGSELGLYKDPYSKFGALTFEMWRAVRLVVDTGIHDLDWSREKAIDYMVQNIGKSEHEATVEVDRYIVWPGQADAYKIGQLKIRELRTRAETELGERFNIREFHDVLLGHGALPLNLLEKQMQDWITKKKNEKADAKKNG